VSPVPAHRSAGASSPRRDQCRGRHRYDSRFYLSMCMCRWPRTTSRTRPRRNRRLPPELVQPRPRSDDERQVLRQSRWSEGTVVASCLAAEAVRPLASASAVAAW